MIEVRGLSRYYGNRKAVVDLTFDVAKGDVFGLIGPNGAGKTTTIKMLATILKPSAGDASICGHSIRHAAREVRGRIGYMPDLHGVYEGMTVADYLRFFAAAYAIPEGSRERTVDQILELVDLGGLRDRLIADLSRGTQQRISLARVLVHDPDVLILDEPASGLDPRARIEIRELLRELKGMGKTILISSHILPELEEVCTRVAIVDQGRLVWTGSPADARRNDGGTRRVRVRPAGRVPEAIEALKVHPAVESAEADGVEILVTLRDGNGSAGFVARALLARDIDIDHLVEERPSLEELFLAVTRRREEGVTE